MTIFLGRFRGGEGKANLERSVEIFFVFQSEFNLKLFEYSEIYVRKIRLLHSVRNREEDGLPPVQEIINNYGNFALSLS